MVQAEKPRQNRPATGGKPKILVIDDSKVVREGLRKLLEDRFEVEEAFDGEDGLLKFQPGKFSVVVCDYHMPKIEGPGVVNAIKKMSPNQPVILLSTIVEDLPPEIIKSIGADSYVSKGDTDLMEAEINRLAKLKE